MSGNVEWWGCQHIPDEAADEYSKVGEDGFSAKQGIANALNAMQIPRVVDVVMLASAICDWREAWEIDPKEKRSFDVVLIDKLTKALRG